MSYLRMIRRNKHTASSPSPGISDTDQRVQTGMVKWFDQVKGIGFIAPLDGSPDVFVSVSAILRSGLDTIQAGQTVEFTLTEASHGKWRAENLRYK